MHYKDIPGNDEALKRLKYRLGKETNEDKIIAFVGAGASCGPYPSWGQLSMSLVDFALRRGMCSAEEARQWAAKIGEHPERITSQIKNKLPEVIYKEFVKETFSPKGKEPYTEIHWLIQQLPLKGLVTTNYDQCALNVASIRCESHITPAIWNDSASMLPWLQGNFELSSFNILHAHGIWTHPDSVIMTKDEYSRAYSESDLRRVLENLWLRDTLLFVGFSFNDKWIEFLSSNIIANHNETTLKHFAFIGLDQENDIYTPDMRVMYINQFRIEPIFYYFNNDDHSVLNQIILDLTGVNPNYLAERLERNLPYNKFIDEENTNNKSLKLNFRSVAISSGKGGVGKSITTLNLAVALSEAGARVLVLDADFGLANIDVMLGLRVEKNLSHVLAGESTLNEVIINGPSGIKLIPSSSGIGNMLNLSPSQTAGMMRAFLELDYEFDFLLVDTPSGLEDNVLNFCIAADDLYVIVQDEATSLTDSYALIKMLHKNFNLDRANILINQVNYYKEAQDTFLKMHKVVDRFLDVTLNYTGFIPTDDSIKKSLRRQMPVITSAPRCRSSNAFQKVADDLLSRANTLKLDSTFEDFLEKLVSTIYR